jgi:hypothetical protein
MSRQRVSLTGLLLLVAAPVLAQKFTATIRGSVTDPSNTVVAGAKVTLTNEATGLTRTATTNDAGSYFFADLPVGSYRLEVTLAGFKSAVERGIVINVADVREVNVELSTGRIAETVSVEASSFAVKTVGAEIAGLVSGEQVRELPLNGRNFLQLTLLQPGVTATEWLNTVNKGLLGGSDISVSGGSITSNMWLVDGADNVDHGSNRTILVYPSVDAIDEFKIQRNNYGAEFGQAGGAQVNVVTRGGTNTFHGSGYYFARRDSWNSTDHFLKQAGLPKAPLKWDDFGGTLGGPILKDKLHFFLSYEKNKDDRTDVRSGFVPTAAERAGDFSGPPLADCTPQLPIDPLTGQPFPGNVIPANRISPAGLALLELYQLPTNTPTSGCSNYVQAVPTPIAWNQINARLDWNISNSTRVMVRYTQDGWKAERTSLLGDSPLSVVGSNVDQPSRSLVAQLTRTIGSNMTNSLTFTYSANVITAARTGDSAVVDQVNRLLPTVYPPSVKEHAGTAQPGLAPIAAGPYGYLWNFAPWENNQSLYVLKDDLSAAFGRHFLKAGLFLSMNAKNEEPGAASQESVVVVGGAGSLTPGGYVPGLTTGNPLADILLEGTVHATSELKSLKSVKQRWRDLEFYVADSYRVTPRVTADFGLRFSHLTPPWMADDQQGNFVLSTVNPALGNSPCNGMEYPPGTNPCPGLGLEGGTDAPTGSLVPIKRLWVAPRLGVAWNVSGDGKTAVRGGLGLFYERERVNSGFSAAGLNPPFSGTAAVIRTLDSTASVVGGAAPRYGAPGTALAAEVGNAHYWQWNVTVERELFRNILVELAYVGSRGLGLVGQTNLNELPPESRLAYAQTGDAALRPLEGISGIGDADLPLWRHDRNSIYHGLQVALTSRFGQGSVLALAYTWSKLIATGAMDSANEVFDSSLAYRDSTQPNLDRARGGTDRTHMFNASLVVALPRLQDKPPFVRDVLGDWELTTIVQAGTGYPVTVGAWVPGLNGPAGTSYWQLHTPNRVMGQPCRVSITNELQWLNPAAFTFDGYQIGTNGTSGRNICDGPGLFQTDASLYKNIHLSSRVKVQLRFEVFNLFDTVNFLGYSLNADYVAQNVMFDTGSPATATKIISAAPPGNFGQLTAARDPRTIQLGIRLVF